jgi:hypothetical protein
VVVRSAPGNLERKFCNCTDKSVGATWDLGDGGRGMPGRGELGGLFRGHFYFRAGLVGGRSRLPRLEVWDMRYARRPSLRCRCVRGWRATRGDPGLGVLVGRAYVFSFAFMNIQQWMVTEFVHAANQKRRHVWRIIVIGRRSLRAAERPELHGRIYSLGGNSLDLLVGAMYKARQRLRLIGGK